MRFVLCRLLWGSHLWCLSGHVVPLSGRLTASLITPACAVVRLTAS
nr:MAG TPA: hypothetical protein [Caudoviricetes sp.]